MGDIRLSFQDSAPSGFLVCDGSTINGTTNPTLSSLVTFLRALGTQYQGSIAAEAFLPDYRGRVPLGAGTGSGLSARTLGCNYGTETHSHTVNSHNHQWHCTRGFALSGYNSSSYNSSGNIINMPTQYCCSGHHVCARCTNPPATVWTIYGSVYTGNASPGTNSPTNSSMQPSIALNMYIKY